jgi:hypothetical protein
LKEYNKHFDELHYTGLQLPTVVVWHSLDDHRIVQDPISWNRFCSYLPDIPGAGFRTRFSNLQVQLYTEPERLNDQSLEMTTCHIFR